MHQLWRERDNFECTEQRLCDQKKQIADKNLLTPAEIDEVKQLVGKDTREEHDQQPDLDPEEQQIPTDADIPVVPEITETPEAIAIDIEYNSFIGDNDDYHKLRDECLDLLEEVKVQPLKVRQKLPKLKNGKNLKGTRKSSCVNARGILPAV